MCTFTTLLFALLAAPAHAGSWGESMEGRASGLFTWATGIAIGDSNEFAPKYGFLGFHGEMIYHARADFSIGLTSGYQLFTGKGRETVEFGDAALTGYQFRFIDVVPILAVGRYYVDVGDSASLFPSLGIGTIYANREVDVGFVGVHDDTWYFGVSPQLGFAYHLPGPDPMVLVKYNFAPGGEETPTEMWFSAELGVMFE
jgi:outer membrane protein